MKQILLTIITAISLTAFAQLTPDPVHDAFELAGFNSSDADSKSGRFD